MCEFCVREFLYWILLLFLEATTLWVHLLYTELSFDYAQFLRVPKTKGDILHSIIPRVRKSVPVYRLSDTESGSELTCIQGFESGHLIFMAVEQLIQLEASCLLFFSPTKPRFYSFLLEILPCDHSYSPKEGLHYKLGHFLQLTSSSFQHPCCLTASIKKA